MSSKSKVIEVEVEKPGKTGSLQIRNVGNLRPLDEIVISIREDHARFEGHSKTAVFLALRIGLRLVWVKNNSAHGSLEPFIKEHLAGISRSSLTNYIRIADAFVSDCELRDQKTYKLTDASKIRPILDQQLELFTDPNAKLDIHCKQLVEWVHGRGLTQMYRDLGREDDSGPPQGHQGGKKPKKQTPEQKAREAFSGSYEALKHDFTTTKWHHLFEKDRVELEKWLDKAAKTVREYNASCAKEHRKAKVGA